MAMQEEELDEFHDDLLDLFKQSDAARFFQEMDRMRRAWGGFHPHEKINKSGLGMLAMVAIWERRGREKITVSELAHCMGHSVPGISQKISTLVAQGYLERTGDPSDRRVSCVRLTESGRKVFREGFQSFHERIKRALDELGTERTEMLLSLMHELSDAIGRVSQEEPEKTERGTEACSNSNVI